MSSRESPVVESPRKDTGCPHTRFENIESMAKEINRIGVTVGGDHVELWTTTFIFIAGKIAPRLFVLKSLEPFQTAEKTSSRY